MSGHWKWARQCGIWHDALCVRAGCLHTPGLLPANTAMQAACPLLRMNTLTHTYTHNLEASKRFMLQGAVYTCGPPRSLCAPTQAPPRTNKLTMPGSQAATWSNAKAVCRAPAERTASLAQFTCVSPYIRTHLPACLLACLPACLLACLSACLLACLLVRLLARMPTYLLACWSACLLPCLSACLPHV